MIVDRLGERGYTYEPEFFTKMFGDNDYHARSTVRVVPPSNWPAEIEPVAAVK
jgi:hypothetical protein